MLFCPMDGAPLVKRSLTSVSSADEGGADPYVGLSLLGQIELRRLAGVGSMARVYRAFQHGVERDVAVKVLPVEPHPPKEDRVDLTPPERITQYVTEEGAFAPDEIAALIDRTPFLAEGYELLRD
jgi:hypothetical protein